MYPLFVLHQGGTERQSSLQDKKTKQKKSRDCGSLESMTGGNLVDQKDELPGHSWCGERTVLEEKLAGRSPGEHPRGTLCNMELQSSGWILSQGTKTVVIKYSSTLLVNLLLCHFLFIDFASVFKTSFR